MKLALVVLITLAIYTGASPTARVAAAGSIPPPCTSAATAFSVRFHFHVSFQGPNQKGGTAVFRNVGTHVCTLKGTPGSSNVHLRNHTGTNLPLQMLSGLSVGYPPSPNQYDAAHGLVRPGFRAFVALVWTNFCGPGPSPYTLVVKLPHLGGTVSGVLRFDPDGHTTTFPSDLPFCGNPNQPSSLDVGSFEIVSQAAQP